MRVFVCMCVYSKSNVVTLSMHKIHCMVKSVETNNFITSGIYLRKQFVRSFNIRFRCGTTNEKKKERNIWTDRSVENHMGQTNERKRRKKNEKKKTRNQIQPHWIDNWAFVITRWKKKKKTKFPRFCWTSNSIKSGEKGHEWKWNRFIWNCGEFLFYFLSHFIQPVVVCDSIILNQVLQSHLIHRTFKVE